MAFSNLFFDADDTLFDFPKAERQAFSALCRAQALPDTKESYRCYSDINAALWLAFNRGQISRSEILTTRFPEFLRAIGAERDAVLCGRIYEQALGEGSFLLPQAEEVCRRLSATHALYILTNATVRIHRRRLAGSAIAPYIARTFISEELGLAKPSAAFYEAVLTALPGANSENTLVVGDSLSADIQGANNAGLPCCWYNPGRLPRPGELRIDFEIRELRELYPIV